MSTLSETTASSRFNLRDRKKTDRKKKRPKRGSDTVGFKIYGYKLKKSSIDLKVIFIVNFFLKKVFFFSNFWFVVYNSIYIYFKILIQFVFLKFFY